MSSTVNNVGGQLAADIASLKVIRHRVALTPDTVPNSEDISDVTDLMQRWPDALINMGAVPRSSINQLYRFICDVEIALVTSSPAGGGAISQNMFHILGEQTGNNVMNAAGIDIDAVLRYGSTAPDTDIQVATAYLTDARDNIVKSSPSAFVSCGYRPIDAVVNVRALDAVLDEASDTTAMVLSKSRCADTSITSIRRTPKLPYFSPVVTGPQTFGYADFHFGSQNSLGQTTHDWSPTIPDGDGLWSVYLTSDQSYMVIGKEKDGTGAVLDNQTDAIFNLTANDCLVKFAVCAPRNASKFSFFDQLAQPAAAFETLDVHPIDLNDAHIHVGSYREALTLVRRDTTMDYYEASVYVDSDVDVEVKITGITLGSPAEDALIMIKVAVDEILQGGASSHGTYSQAGTPISGDLYAAMNTVLTDDPKAQFQLESVDEALGALRRYNAYLCSNAINGPGRAMRNAYLTVATTADTYVPSVNGAEFLMLDFYLRPNFRMSATTKRRVFGVLGANISSMLQLCSADDQYAAVVGSC